MVLQSRWNCTTSVRLRQARIVLQHTALLVSTKCETHQEEYLTKFGWLHSCRVIWTFVDQIRMNELNWFMGEV
jgi:hypothetical protein